ncbi:glycoside hydrolase family 15 protein [Burkholderia multivorans]|uniref:glycoside hydrolase family 15 protein n=1 Tax=Burkholderia multivorans TaxID=87883 RepID=UPI000CFEB325|nr:glycoside hydrolase family 15 protein [Burkholderia multivorans]MCL4630429.1 glycoside hydrolase family 15 protein [Burkholderia multivorans]MCO1362684.1 glycoside hydrolase family 15 protein [Burkholderia multivorans]MCO1385874.1 glycoside hydrolase family 15 protein [Burkholderia multivorans]MCO1389558.1 glycoside hydrolase family 15 protein [Burkholderia multivorans]MCO1404217.1 glycoside hydrolase family 15 protein [Burkholderia multivorans]
MSATPIEDYAPIGDGRSAALVARDGSIDWLCWPDFDSPPCFAALIGTPENGRFRLAPREPDARATRRYLPGTAILETTFDTSSGRIVVIDWMSWAADDPCLIRSVRGEHGCVALDVELGVRFDYGYALPWCRRFGRRWRMMTGGDAMWVDTDARLDVQDDRLVGTPTIAAGERIDICISYARSYDRAPAVPDAYASLRDTHAFWRAWSRSHAAQGPYGDAIERALTTIKLLTSRRTGGIVAAPTSSLPERFGGVRNWDYRFCWLRDASFTLRALARCGYRDEAAGWRDWLVRAIANHPSQLQVLYAADGSRRADEWQAEHLAGYGGARPVRFGNAAAQQQQLDVYGEVLGALYQARRHGLPPDDDAWLLERRLIDHLATIWREPDEGIWEVRSGRHQFTSSKAMVWAAVESAYRSARAFGHHAPLDDWRRWADTVRDEVLARGYHAKLGRFVDRFDGDGLDVSLLLIPLSGMLDASDPRVAATVAAIERELLEDGLPFRYRPERFVDGCEGDEGAFVAAGFWLAQVYRLQRRDDDAHALFERLLALRNDVGLLSEEYDVHTHRMCGNFPFTLAHVALVNAALALQCDAQQDDVGVA